jgi:cobalt-precorrin-6B (C15)-methyltransferase
LHGNKKLSPFILALEQGYEMMVFTGGLHSATDLLKIAALVSPNRRGTLGVNLSLPGEFIQSGTVQELCSTHLSQSDLALIYLSPGERKGIGFFEDEDYIRTNIPFSKKETRMMVCSLLELSPAMTVLEIGGGSGGITIDIARRISEGILFSLEKNQEACQLIQQNCERFRIDNVQCIHSTAPNDIPQKLFDRIFIGGSGGSLSSIIDNSSKVLKKGGILVMTALSLLHVTEGINLIKNNPFQSLSIFQQSISRIDPNDKNLMMKSLNPIFFIKAVKS